MLVNIYLIILLIIKLFFFHKIARGKTFYFSFFRAAVFLSSSYILFALITNSIFSVHIFSNHISNYLFPLLDLLIFILTTFFFTLFVAKYAPSITDRYFNLIINFMFLVAAVGMTFKIYFFVMNRFNFLEFFFPFGSLITGIIFITPLFGAFHWLRLNKHQKTITVLLILSSILISFLGGSRSSLIFTFFFIFFWCFRISLLKKMLFTAFFCLAFVQLQPSILLLKHLTSSTLKNLNMNQKIAWYVENKANLNYSNFKKIAINRILHSHRLVEPVYKELKTKEDVGIQPIITSLYAFIPSKFLYDKPHPGSIDGTKYTSFEYLVNDIAFNKPYDMSGYSISLKLFWYGSYLIGFCSTILSIIILIVLYRVALYFGDRLAILPLLATFPGIYNYFVPDLSRIILMTAYVYLPGLIILVIFKFFLDYNRLIKAIKSS